MHPPIWNTGTTYTIPLQGRLDEATARNYAARFYLVGLLARKAFLQRTPLTLGEEPVLVLHGS